MKPPVKPYIYSYKPSAPCQFIREYVKVKPFDFHRLGDKLQELYGDISLSQLDWSSVYFDTELDHGSGYYESDYPSVVINCSILSPTETPNPAYEKELKAYNKALNKYTKSQQELRAANKQYKKDLAAYVAWEEEEILRKAEEIKKKRK